MQNYSGEYQDIEIEGTLLSVGKRECAKRWQIIKPHILPNSSIVDIGSYHGYFGIKISREIENTTVLSIESNSRWVSDQVRIVQANKLLNIAVSKHSFSLHDLEWLSNVVEGIDYFMMLSVLEYFPENDIEKIIKLISEMCPHFIVEFPGIEETKAAGYNNIQKFSPFEEYLSKYFDKVRVIGKAIATTDHSMFRNIYLAENKYFKRNNLKSSKDHFKSRDHTLEYENDQWKMEEVNTRNREWITGFNLHNLLKFNIIYPTSQWFLEQSRLKYQEIFNIHKEISDISLKNILFTPIGLQVIDYLERRNVKTQKEFDMHFNKFIDNIIKHDNIC